MGWQTMEIISENPFIRQICVICVLKTSEVALLITNH